MSMICWTSILPKKKTPKFKTFIYKPFIPFPFKNHNELYAIQPSFHPQPSKLRYRNKYKATKSFFFKSWQEKGKRITYSVTYVTPFWPILPPPPPSLTHFVPSPSSCVLLSTFTYNSALSKQMLTIGQTQWSTGDPGMRGKRVKDTWGCRSVKED